MSQLEYDNIFDAITDDPAEAVDLQFRADLMSVIRDIIDYNGWDQKQAASELGISQPRISELLGGKVTKYSSDKLIKFLAILGFSMKPSFTVTRRTHKTSVKKAKLKVTVNEREVEVA